mmetsp:Transcript_6070/g.17029  ORF Transcript_6070/g.17029 Transcript_6070/m.17029 type:complete len:276 (+) Transcript_6070:54-881(+)
MAVMNQPTKSVVDLLQEAILDLEARLNLQPGEAIPEQLLVASSSSAAITTTAKDSNDTSKKANNNNHHQNNKNKNNNQKKHKQQQQQQKQQPQKAANNNDQPDICKLEFKVGVITKVWVHPTADKLYCEEIDVGEEAGPRQIASGLRPHFTLEQMLGQRLLVASNLKAKNLVGFKSHGMVLCAARPKDNDDGGGGEVVEFVEPPEGAAIGEVITYEGLPTPEPFTPSGVDKKKIWPTAAQGMKTTDDCCAAWNGHVFMTRAGPCKTKTIAGFAMR